MKKDPTEFRKRFAKWKAGAKPYQYGVPYEDDNHNTDYDLARANLLNYSADETGHYPTRDYETGRYLKSPTHPTVTLGTYTDMELGYDVWYNKNDKSLYSQPNFTSTYKDRLPKYAGGKPAEYVQAGKDNSWVRVTNDPMGAVFLDLVVRPLSRGGNTTVGNWKRLWAPKYEKPLETVSPEFDILSLFGGIKQMVSAYKHIPGLKIKPLNTSNDSWIHIPQKQLYVRKPYSVSWDDFVKKPEVGKYFDEGGEALVHESKNRPGYLTKLKSEIGEGETLDDLEFMVNRDLHINDLPGTEPITYKGFSVSKNPVTILDRVSGKPKTILNERFYPIYEQRKLTPSHKVNTSAFGVDQEALVNEWAALYGYDYLPNGWLRYGNISVSDQGFNNFAFDAFGNIKFIDPMIQTF